MAKNSLIMGYILRKNKNAKSVAFNKWYAYVDNKGVLSTRGLAHHMVEHGLTNLADGLLIYIGQAFLLAGSIFGLDYYVEKVKQEKL